MKQNKCLNRTRRITIRLSDNEYKYLSDKAKLSDKKLSEYVRQMLSVNKCDNKVAVAKKPSPVREEKIPQKEKELKPSMDELKVLARRYPQATRPMLEKMWSQAQI